MKKLIFCLFLLQLVCFCQRNPLYYVQIGNEQLVTNVDFSPLGGENLDSCLQLTCEECLASPNCLWCGSDKPHCFNPIFPFSCPVSPFSSIGLISDIRICKTLTSGSCNYNTCSDCLSHGCKWCDGDGSGTYPAICTPIASPVNCAYGALHFPGGSCKCGGASDCTTCLSTYGCAWCDGDGSTLYPPMCFPQGQPFSCSIGAFHGIGGIC